MADINVLLANPVEFKSFVCQPRNPLASQRHGILQWAHAGVPRVDGRLCSMRLLGASARHIIADNFWFESDCFLRYSLYSRHPVDDNLPRA